MRAVCLNTIGEELWQGHLFRRGTRMPRLLLILPLPPGRCYSPGAFLDIGTSKQAVIEVLRLPQPARVLDYSVSKSLLCSLRLSFS
jgi:hypothetical protein